MIRSFIVLLSWFMLAHGASAAGELRQQAALVTGANGKPIAGATVRTITAEPLVGEDRICPTVFAGLGKTYTTDAEGKYELTDLDPELEYRLVMTAPGFKRHLVEHVSPTASETLNAKLQPQAEPVDPAEAVTGRVTDVEGRPLAGALVELVLESTKPEDDPPQGEKRKTADVYSVTGDDGAFLNGTAGGRRTFFARVLAYGYAGQVVSMSTAPDAPGGNDVRLSRGSTVTGRLVKDGQPMRGVRMMLAQVRQRKDQFVGYFEIGTDAEGKFTFEHLPEAEDYGLIAAMTSLGSRGATQPMQVTTAAVAGDATDVGDVNVEPALTLSGTFAREDGVTHFQGLVAWLMPEGIFEHRHTAVEADGSFTFTGLPANHTWYLQINGNPKLRLSAGHPNFLPRRDALLGKLDKDATLRVKLAPSSTKDETPEFDQEAFTRLRAKPFEDAPPTEPK